MHSNNVEQCFKIPEIVMYSSGTVQSIYYKDITNKEQLLGKNVLLVMFSVNDAPNIAANFPSSGPFSSVKDLSAYYLAFTCSIDHTAFDIQFLTVQIMLLLKKKNTKLIMLKKMEYLQL